MLTLLTFALAVLLIGSVECANGTAPVTVANTTAPEAVHVMLNGTFELDCDRLEAHVWSEPVVSNATGNTTTETSPTTALPSPNNYSLHLFKKDELVVQLYNSKLRVVASGLQNAGNYECGYYNLDKFGKLNYVFRKSWTVQITVPTVTSTTTTAVPAGEAVVAQESLSDSIDLDKRNINIFTYSNWALIVFLVTGFLVICAAFLVVVLLFNVRTCRSCQRPRGKELL